MLGADISGRSGRVARTRNMVLGSDASEETWRALDERVNTYPTKRAFKGEPKSPQKCQGGCE